MRRDVARRRRSRETVACALGLALCIALAACGRVPSRRAPQPAASSVGEAAKRRAIAELRREENERRAHTDFSALPPSNRAFGANPYALAAVAGTPYFAGILRGDSRVVLLDANLATLSSLPTVASPSALATAPDGAVFVAGPLGARVERFRVRAGGLEPDGALALPEGTVVRALGADEKTLVVVDFVGDRLLTLPIATARAVPAGGAGSHLASPSAMPPHVAPPHVAPPHAVPSHAAPPHVTPTCAGPVRLALTARHLAVACLFEHAVAVFARDASGAPTPEIARITHDGPLWSVALLEHENELFIGAGGVEDHPLERRDRVFGYIDSFAYLYALEPDGLLERRKAVNTSELGVVVPKAVALREHAGTPELLVLGYATAPLLSFTANAAPTPRVASAPSVVSAPSVTSAPSVASAPSVVSAPSVTSAPNAAPTPSVAPTPNVVLTALPGCSDLVVSGERLLCANPLFDAWLDLTSSGATLHPARPAAPSDPNATERLGEALFFTTLMAPDARADGRLSRFTCETCHFEGATDGRVHNSGRHAFDSPDDVRVSTRPLFGLFNDAPLFSRAHDRDLTSVCDNEFTVVSRGNPVDPWFSLETARFPWLRELGEARPSLSPSDLRRALFEFFARFTHEENPFVAAHAPAGSFTPRERHGAELFRDHCERCHAARLVANDAGTRVPFARWETLVFSAATPIVWARGDYEKTGVVPYVDREGTRIPSLRRLYLKRPYFTNGSARSLADVLERARFTDDRFLHAESAPARAAASPSGAVEHDETSPSGVLDADERRALLAFLRLL